MIFVMAIVSSAPSIKTISSDIGYSIQPTIKDYLRADESHEFEIHVFNITNGVPIRSDISCYMHLYFKGGDHIYTGESNTPEHLFDYSFNLSAGNFSESGIYQAKFQCNSSTLGGGDEIEFFVNNYGEELTQAISFNFNMAMIFLMILFILSIVGIFSLQHYIGKFTCYWVAHLLFVVGTFSVWQFNHGYDISYSGLSGIFKVLFYFSAISFFPMLILSLVWIFYIHLMSEEIQNMIHKGMSPDEAVERANRKNKGWFKW